MSEINEPKQVARPTKKPIKNSAKKTAKKPNIKHHNFDVTSRGLDHLILFAVVSLMLFGIIMVFSSSYYSAATDFNNPFYYAKKQIMFSLMGIVVIIIAANFPFSLYRSKYKNFPSFPVFLYFFSIVLILFTSFFGMESGGKKRWLQIPFIGIGLQASEVGKLAIVIFIAYLIYKNRQLLDTTKGIFSALVPVGILSAVVMYQDVSTALVIAVVGLSMLFAASKNTKLFILLAIICFILLFGALFIDSFLDLGYHGARFEAWLDPFSAGDTGLQIRQSLYAVGSGGPLGLGLGNSRVIFLLPEAHNDIIFAIICEELGLVGASLVLLLFGVIIWRGFKISLTCKDVFGSYLAFGLTMIFAVQVVVNVCVVTNTIPNTGIPMPFISAGGSSLIVSAGMIGILLNISKDCNYNKR